MSFRDISKKIPRAIARYGLFASAWLFDRLPRPVIWFLMHVFIAIGFRFTIRQRKIAYESIRIAFGEEKTPQEIRQIVKKCFEHVGRGMIELFYYMAHPDKTKEDVKVIGKEYLDGALKKGHGVIAVTAHFGNFPLMMLNFSQSGYKTSSIIRPTRDVKVEQFLLKKRTQCGLNTVYAIPRQKCVAESLKVLRNNEILFIPLDQNFGNGSGVFVDFFGQKAATATGPVVLSLRTKAAILPMFIMRNEGETHTIVIEPPVEIEQQPTEEQTIQLNIEKITKLIEQYIRKYPYEWGWMHRRWKSRPQTEGELKK